MSPLQIAAITGGGHPGFAKELYLYLISKPEYQTPQQRQSLMRRLREGLVKLVSVIGVPKPLEAVFCMGEVEREEDKDYSFSRYGRTSLHRIRWLCFAVAGTEASC